ncbi:MAG: conserved exported protein of unknown function [Nitrosopumilales archaeon]|nr:MAG: conserved exported protein of unknown function [Nitrosopumilales archaeon]
MRKMIFMIFAILCTVPILGVDAETPFDVTSDGVTIQSHQLDYETMSIIFAVEVSESPGTLKIAFDRDFFDAIYQGHDDEFLIIVDGELISYSEVRSTPYDRTVQFQLYDGVDEVEIFGTTLKGQIIEQNTESLLDNDVINFQQSEQELDENEELVNQVEQLKLENVELENENEGLSDKIFDLENLLDAMEDKISDLNAIIMEQIKVIYTWIKF